METEVKNVFMHSRMAMFLLGTTIAAGLAVSAYLVGRAAVHATRPEYISVKGSACRTVRSDSALWHGSFSTRAVNLADGYNKLSQDREQVLVFLRGQGFSDAEIAFSSIEITKNFKRDVKGNVTNEIENYDLRQCVSVTSAKVDSVEKMSREFTSLVSRNIFARSLETNYLISDLEKYKMELLGEATCNAHERAQTLARSAGGKIGKLVSAKQGIFQITAPASGITSDIGEYDKTTILKEVKAVVTLQFMVQ